MDETLIQQSENEKKGNLSSNAKTNAEGKDDKKKVTLKNLSKSQRDLLLSGGIGLAGIAAGAGAFAIMSMNSSEPVPTPEPNPDPIPGTTPEPITIYSEAPIAHNITDDMSFGKAFGAARKEVGEGGFFEWKGNLYSTYYKEEWNAMTDTEKAQFQSSIDKSTEVVDDNKDDDVDSEVTENAHDEENVTAEDKTDNRSEGDAKVTVENKTEDAQEGDTKIDTEEIINTNDNQELEQENSNEQENPEETIEVDPSTRSITNLDETEEDILEETINGINDYEQPDITIDLDENGNDDIIILDNDSNIDISGQEEIIEIDSLNIEEYFDEVEVEINEDYNDLDDMISTDDKMDIEDNNIDNDIEMDDIV